MRHEIVTYCSSNFTDCLNKSIHTWSIAADAILVYTDDSEKLGAMAWPKGVEIKQIHDEKETGKRENCMRKIDAIEAAITKGISKEIDFVTWLDADCFVLRDFRKLYLRIQADLLCTRMVIRHARIIRTVNAGVSFWRVNESTLEFCKRWRARALELEPTRNLHEQDAFNELCYKCFDWNGPCLVAPVSEKKFNLERDDKKGINDLMKRDIEKFKPFIVHLKGGRWENYKQYLP
jgi:hypothetical protein